MSVHGAPRAYLSVLLATVAVCACAREHRVGARPHEVEVEVATVGLDRESGGHFVLLEDEPHHRQLPIMIGGHEAQAIMLELHGLKPPRPLTHDLLRSIIEKTGNRVDRVVIYDLRAEVYYAKIYLDRGKYALDSRPSDAIVLAIGARAPIYVNAKLLFPRAELGLGPSAHLPESARGAGLTVQELTPGLAAAFNVAPGSGLLVAAVDERAGQAGVERGDLVTKIGGQPVARLADFARALSAAGQGQPLTLTIRRGGAERTVTLKAAGRAGR